MVAQTKIALKFWPRKVWQQASAARKKLVQFHPWKEVSQSQNIANGRPFVPNAGEQHRLFVLSVDLMQEAENKPWVQTLEKTPAGAHKADQRQGGFLLAVLVAGCSSWRSRMGQLTLWLPLMGEVALVVPGWSRSLTPGRRWSAGYSLMVSSSTASGPDRSSMEARWARPASSTFRSTERRCH